MEKKLNKNGPHALRSTQDSSGERPGAPRRAQERPGAHRKAQESLLSPAKVVPFCKSRANLAPFRSVTPWQKVVPIFLSISRFLLSDWKNTLPATRRRLSKTCPKPAGREKPLFPTSKTKKKPKSFAAGWAQKLRFRAFLQVS